MGVAAVDKNPCWLYPGQLLRITRQAAGLGKENCDVSLLASGRVVRYLRPSWLLVELDDGEQVEVNIDALERMEDGTYG